MTRLLSPGPSIETLYAQHATRGRTGSGAPATGPGEVMIARPAATVWALLADPAGGGSTGPTIHDVCLAGEVWPGTQFTWRNGRARIRSRFAVVDPPHQITRTGVSSGVKAAPRHRRPPRDTARARARDIHRAGTTERTVT